MLSCDVGTCSDHVNSPTITCYLIISNDNDFKNKCMKQSVHDKHLSLALHVTIWLIHPSHGGAYMVEGHLLLGSDWLIVVQEPCTFIHRRALYQYVIPSDLIMCLGLWSGPLSPYHHYRVVLCFIVPLTWYLVSHDRLIPPMDLWPCLLMFQGLP